MIVVDEEFKNLIPPLSAEEFQQLEENCVREGIRDALIVWPQEDGTEILIDGHNRWAILGKHINNLEPKFKPIQFKNREQAKEWIIKNQFGRRNLSAYDRSLLALELKPMIAEKAKENILATQNNKDSSAHQKSDKQINTSKELAKVAGVSHDTIHKVETIQEKATEQDKADLRAGTQSINQVFNKIKKVQKEKEIEEAREKIKAEQTEGEKAYLTVGNGIGFVPMKPYDLLLTDPPYSTDVDDINKFVDSWLYNALNCIAETGFAYVFIGAYPDELKAYLNARTPEHIELKQVLVWTYKNTLGNNPKDRYKLNYQACLFYRGINAPDLNCPLTTEQWAVQEINAPDGRQGDRFHAWQKPSEIAERFIRHSTQKGMTVFDPFACTGTFLLAATKLGRSAYGFEINPDNAEIAFKRGCVKCHRQF